MLKTLAVLSAALVLACTASAQQHIVPGSRVFIQPTSDGFETYLQAAFTSKSVPLNITGDRSKATYIIVTSSEIQKPGWAKTVFVSPRAEANASVSIQDAHTGDILFGYSVDKFAARHGEQSTAEACAKHIKKFIEKQ